MREAASVVTESAKKIVFNCEAFNLFPPGVYMDIPFTYLVDSGKNGRMKLGSAITSNHTLSSYY